MVIVLYKRVTGFTKEYAEYIAKEVGGKQFRLPSQTLTMSARLQPLFLEVDFMQVVLKVFPAENSFLKKVQPIS